MSARMSSSLDRARGMLSGYTPGQRGIILVGVLALVLGAVGLSRWAAQPSWTPLFSNLSTTDANVVVGQLRADNVQYQLSGGGTTVLVPQSQVDDLRVALAGKLPNSDGNGYSVLDKQGMTATDFQQNIAYQRALEGELAKTLQAINGVSTAIVHVAIPKKDVFTTDAAKPTASVLLALQPGVKLTRDQVRSVTHLVAGSVPSLDPNDVTVTDATGALLSSKSTGLGADAASANDNDQQTAAYEDRLSGSVQQMLDRVLGPGHAVVRVNALLNFDTRDTTSETFVTATGVPPLSESKHTENYTGANTAAGGALGQTLPNLTPAPGATGAGAYSKTDSTVDNAVGKVVSRAQAAPGTVQRLTVAVVLDSKVAGATDATQVQQLVSNAVGLDTKRGDTVQVDKLAFDTTAMQAATKELATAQAAQKTAGYLDLGKKAGLGLLAVIVLLVAMRRRKKQPTIEAVAADLPGGTILMPPSLAAIGAAPATYSLPSVDFSERDRLRDEVAQFVDSQPEEISALVQGWLSQRKG